MWWFQRGVCALPATLVVWTSTTFILNYLIGVLLGHIDALVPYVSDISSEIPERGLFGLMLSVSSFLGVATVYVRYKQVQALTVGGDHRLIRLNLTGLVLGIFSSLGLCLIANFQKNAVMSVHLLGTALTFGAGAFYIMVQSGLSFRMQPRFHGKDIMWARIGLGLWALASMVVVFVSSVILYDELGVDMTPKLHWTPGEKGYGPHMVSTISEWSLAFSFVFFFLTYIRDFQKISFQMQTVLQNNHLYDYTQYDVRVHVHPGENSPLLSGSL